MNSKRRVHVFADVPHLLKNIRKHIVETGFKFSDNFVLSRKHFENVIQGEHGEGELNLLYKISVTSHLNYDSTRAQNVRLAAELLSRSMSCAMEKFSSSCDNSGEYMKASKKVMLINQWFDVMNSRQMFEHNNELRCGFGLYREKQVAILNEMTKEFSRGCVFNNRCSFIVFQKGVVMSNESLKRLDQDLQKRFSSYKYVLTSHLNQDVLENFFSVIRGTGGFNDHPLPVDFQLRFKIQSVISNVKKIDISKKAPVQYSNSQALVNVPLKNLDLLKEFEAVMNCDDDTSGDSVTSAVINEYMDCDLVKPFKPWCQSLVAMVAIHPPPNPTIPVKICAI